MSENCETISWLDIRPQSFKDDEKWELYQLLKKAGDRIKNPHKTLYDLIVDLEKEVIEAHDTDGGLISNLKHNANYALYASMFPRTKKEEQRFLLKYNRETKKDASVIDLTTSEQKDFETMESAKRWLDEQEKILLVEELENQPKSQYLLVCDIKEIELIQVLDITESPYKILREFSPNQKEEALEFIKQLQEK